jgi:hypothetical protein
VSRRKATLAREFAPLTFDRLDRVVIVALKGSAAKGQPCGYGANLELNAEMTVKDCRADEE